MTVYLQPGSPYYLCEFMHQGKRVRRSTGTEKKREAEAFERDLRKQLEERTAGGFVQMTFAECVQRYRETVIEAGNGNLAVFKARVKRLGEAFGWDTYLDDITGPVVHRWRDSCLKGGKNVAKADGKRGERRILRGTGMKPGAINTYLGTLRGMLRKAHLEWGTLAKFPKLVSLPDPDGKRVRYLTDDEERRMLAHAPKHLCELLIFLIDTGARKNEAIKLPWRNVHNIRPGSNQGAYVVLEHNPEAGVSVKNRKTRTVPLTPRVQRLLWEMRQEQDKAKEAGKTVDGSRVFVWLNQWKALASFTDVKGALKATCAAARVKGVSLHVMRHTFASRLVMLGEPLLNVAKLLGHSSTLVTERYAHLAPSALEDTIARLGKRKPFRSEWEGRAAV